MDVLGRILTKKREEVAHRRNAAPLAELRERPLYGAVRRPFAAALRGGQIAVIAEIKKASPSRGLIRKELDVRAVASAYEREGAAALSVLTDEQFFQGRLEDLSTARETVALPVLRKDFIVDSYQLHEALAWGADAVLLIAAALERGRLRELHAEARALGMDALVEVHSAAEAARAIEAGGLLIGINNRDLRSFAVDLATTERIAPLLPRGVTAVSESGIADVSDLRRLIRAGVRAVLIGEAFMRSPDPGKALAALLEGMKEEAS